MTPGTDRDTADGMNLARIRHIIDQIRHERFRFKPARRTYLPKKNGGKRPLGIPTFNDKLVQEALRQILEAYYEPRFRDSSHGFRTGYGCHTALTRIKRQFRGTVWFIEGDIRGCFDNINHDILMAILARDIRDGRLLNLIRMSLEAGVLDNWQYHRTYSGTPQGGVLSPLLANIYLNELDSFVEDILIPQYTRGKRKATNPEYQALSNSIQKARKSGDIDLVHELERERRQLPSLDVNDLSYRRLYYVRYADDFLLGFTGTKAEAKDIKNALGQFLHETLGLEMSNEKPLITHARSGYAHFLGYAVSVYHSNHMRSYDRRVGGMKRSVNGQIRLGVPFGLVDQHCKRYMKHGKPIHEPALEFCSAADIILRYQQRYRGLVEYYKYATDRGQFNKLRYIMETALTKTLAHKFKISVKAVYRRFRGKRDVGGYTYNTLEVEVQTDNGSHIIWWGAVPLKVIKPEAEPVTDQKHVEWAVYSDVIQRLKANTCELCGSHGNCEVHHVRKLSDLKKRWAGRRSKPFWVKRMIAMHRKPLIVCQQCHINLHAGRPTPSKRK
ncbi:reverse transcriptase domain-containing protein [Chloroflexota bacterium]